MKSYHHLTQEQRYQIRYSLQLGVSRSDIAKRLNVDKSNITRELERNSVNGIYNPDNAQGYYSRRRLRCRKHFKLVGALLNTVVEKLKLYWSPEQISGWLKKEERALISYECIYQYLERNKSYGGTLYKCLRHGRKIRKKRFAKERQKQILNRTSIDKRPEYINTRTELGHWERDAIMGINYQSGLAVHVERKICFVRIKRLVNKTAKRFSKITIKLMQNTSIPCKSITNDNGVEFADHIKTSKELETTIYFSHPYSSWECGSVENTNGLIRQFFPKKTDFTNISKNKIKRVEFLLNSRPRKKLGYLTPLEALALELH